MLSTVVMGVFGAFLRWLQNVSIYDADSGLATPWAGISVVLLLFTVVILALHICFSHLWLRDVKASPDVEKVFHTEKIYPVLIGSFCGILMATGGTLLMFSAGSTTLPVMQRLLGAFAIVAGVCFPFLPSRVKYEGASQLGKRITSSVVTLFYCFWLVFSYRSGAQVPSLWRYGPEIVAICAGALAFYYVCGWAFERVKPKTTLLALQFAAYMCIGILPDSRQIAVTLFLIGSAIMLLMMEFLMVHNLKRTEEPESEDKDKQARPSAKPEA